MIRRPTSGLGPPQPPRLSLRVAVALVLFAPIVVRLDRRRARTRLEIARDRAKAIREQLRQDAVAPAATRERLRLRDFAESWLRSKLAGLKASTARRYAEALDLHILPALGDHYVDAIEAQDLIAWRDAQAASRTVTTASGERRTIKTAAETVNHRLRVLKTVLREAVEQLDMPRDPTARVKALPKRSAGAEEERRSLNADELRRVLQQVRARYPQWYPLILTLALTGLRFGEATALKWSDLDFDKGLLRVRRAQWNGHIDAPKTRSSRRTVALASELADVLREHRRAMVAAQVPGLDEGWVFISTAGTLLTSGVLMKPVRNALEAAGITRPFKAAHGFRHTFNNLARQVAEAEVVRAMTGHVTEQMTEHYSWVELGEKSEAVARVAQLVVGPVSPQRA